MQHLEVVLLGGIREGLEESLDLGELLGSLLLVGGGRGRLSGAGHCTEDPDAGNPGHDLVLVLGEHLTDGRLGWGIRGVCQDAARGWVSEDAQRHPSEVRGSERRDNCGLAHPTSPRVPMVLAMPLGAGVVWKAAAGLMREGARRAKVLRAACILSDLGNQHKHV